VLAVALAAALALAAPGAETAETAEREPAAPVYTAVAIHGRVVLDTSSTRFGMPAVVFDHWRHRALYTCRVCHVDVGFAMKAGETRISAGTNENGTHCGACHNGKTQHQGRPIFRACAGWPRNDPARGCPRCHAGASAGVGADHAAFVRAMPVDVAGDIDWAAAARRSLIRPADAVEGVTLKRSTMRIDRDVEIRPLGSWMNAVTFSHRRHVTWVACELCHPEVFPVTKRGSFKYDMAEMWGGRHCGACHLSVAFPLFTCPRCHAGGDGRAVR
jgi:c(7)-type cytochrome triheme protein